MNRGKRRLNKEAPAELGGKTGAYDRIEELDGSEALQSQYTTLVHRCQPGKSTLSPLLDTCIWFEQQHTRAVEYNITRLLVATDPDERLRLGDAVQFHQACVEQKRGLRRRLELLAGG